MKTSILFSFLALACGISALTPLPGHTLDPDQVMTDRLQVSSTSTLTTTLTVTVTVRKSDGKTLGTFSPTPVPEPTLPAEAKTDQTEVSTTSTTVTSTSTRITTVTSELPESKTWTTETITSCATTHCNTPTPTPTESSTDEEEEECEELPEEMPEETKSANIPVVTLVTTTRIPKPANSTTTFIPQPMPTGIKGNNTQVTTPEPSEAPTQTPELDAPVFEGRAGKMQGGLWGMMAGLAVVGLVMSGF